METDDEDMYESKEGIKLLEVKEDGPAANDTKSIEHVNIDICNESERLNGKEEEAIIPEINGFVKERENGEVEKASHCPNASNGNLEQLTLKNSGIKAGQLCNSTHSEANSDSEQSWRDVQIMPPKPSVDKCSAVASFENAESISKYCQAQKEVGQRNTEEMKKSTGNEKLTEKHPARTLQLPQVGHILIFTTEKTEQVKEITM